MADRSRVKQEPAMAISRQWLNENANQIGIILTKLTDIKNVLDTSTNTAGNREDTNAELEKVIAELQDEQVLFLQTIKQCETTFVVEDKSASSQQDILTRLNRLEAKAERFVEQEHLRDALDRLEVLQKSRQAKLPKVYLGIAFGATVLGVAATTLAIYKYSLYKRLFEISKSAISDLIKDIYKLDDKQSIEERLVFIKGLLEGAEGNAQLLNLKGLFHSG